MSTSHTAKPLILSASRRTDLPGFYPDVCAERIRGRVRRARTRVLYGVVFWSRHPRPFIEKGDLAELVRDELENPHLNLTLTGLGGTPLEPGGPALGEVVSSLEPLVRAFHGQPWRIRWRFDPILRNRSTLALFEKIAEAVTDAGIRDCIFSFPSYRSLKGNLSPHFEAAKIPAWTTGARDDFAKRLCDSAEKMGITLLACCQPFLSEVDPRIRRASCIDPELLEKGHPEKTPLCLPKDPSQRTDCLCVVSEDIGRYDDWCGGGCAYCYSKAGGAEGRQNWLEQKRNADANRPQLKLDL